MTREDVLARSNATPIPGSIDIAGKADPAKPGSLVKDVSLGGLLVGRFQNIALPPPEGDLTLFVNVNSLSDLWIGLTWGGA